MTARTPPPSSAAEVCARYAQRLRLPAGEREALVPEAGSAADPKAALGVLHARLAGAAVPLENPAYASVRRRLELAWPIHQSLDRPIFDKDVQGRMRVVTTPPFSRATMVPQPWLNNPVKRFGRWVRERVLGRRGRFASPGQPELLAPPPTRSWKWAARRRRTVLTLLVALQTYVASYYMAAVLPYHGGTPLELAELVIYAVLFAWISFGFWTAMMGFWSLLIGRDRFNVARNTPADVPIGPEARTALVMPICNESVARVYAGLRATYESVAKAGALAHFDFFVLSDSGSADARVAELAAWRALCAAVGGFGRIFYRHRVNRIKRKSGNIGDFCRRWGGRYRYMVILDADSVMSGTCLQRLVQIMEAHPNAGIVQTAPRAAGHDTLYARLQQFATRVYGPLFTAGLHFWQLGESHYWGHNAIIRVAPFIRHCALGRLPGHGALAGEILSHDFVEAALMRSKGWSVWIAYDLPGSYEEMPPNLLDELKRDRRWCQGNLMNFRLFLTKGLNPAHRAIFMTGVMAYLSAPIWFVFLLLSTALLVIRTVEPPTYFAKPYQLFPVWPEWHPGWAVALFSATAVLLFLPKVLAALLIVAKGARAYGGALRLLASTFLELLISTLLAPIRMLFHTRFVISALMGIATQWKSPQRENAETSWGMALAHHLSGTLLGTVWAAGVYWVEPGYLWWLAPIVGALIISIPLSVYASRRSLGLAARRAGLLLIPEESEPPVELQATTAYDAAAGTLPGVREAVVDPSINALVCGAGEPRPVRPRGTRVQRDHMLEDARERGPEALDALARNTLISDPLALSTLHVAVWADLDVARRWGMGEVAVAGSATDKVAAANVASRADT
ncbi:MAG: glucans biosynthesis glucosyltransferase MdoH [Nevskiaceae bacterium]|nr:MAG: glucans biosynthesis glucosyltransferase MdoH [Nevskiaceae bacterium]TBR72047.1 MAG: glucans biosynthesis glucosyltransferase MdoH [Nevskiaceae bacterium]